MNNAMIDWIIARLQVGIEMGVHFHGRHNGDHMRHWFHELKEAQ